MDLSKKFVYSGVLQRVCKEIIAPGKNIEVDALGVVGLVNGVYEVNATVEEIRAGASKTKGSGKGAKDGNGGDDGATEIADRIERRIWHARRPWLIRVVDGDGDGEGRAEAETMVAESDK